MSNYTGNGHQDDWGGMYPAETRNEQNDSFQEMKAVMKQINQDWEEMTSEDFNPVPLSLQLLDDSSLGRDYNFFLQTKKNLDRALQFIVNDYYQGFNSSIGTFGGVIQSIGDSQERVKEMKTRLKSCKEALLSKRSDLFQLWIRSQQYKEMIRILDLIEDFKGTPEKLEGLLREKHFLTASKLLLDSIRMLDRKEMVGIGALSDLRRYLKAQHSSLHELLIEELHDHLYVKSAYCDSRWVKYIKDQKELPSPLMEWDGRENRKMTLSGTKNKKNLQVNTGHGFNTPLSPKSPKPFGIIFNEDEEIAITQRIPIELYQLVDKTVAEVEERNADTIAIMKTKKNDSVNGFSLESPENDTYMEILRDLLWTLYSKLDAVMQGHRFVVDIVEMISKRPEYSKITAEPQKIRPYPFSEIWKPVQSEVRTLLRDYITDDERETQMFKFGDVDATSNTTLDNQYEIEVKSYLQNSLPELFSKVPDERQLSVFVVDRFANTNITAGHRLVVYPDAFNVSVLFKPTLAFLEKVKTIIPPGANRSSADFTTFLDDFVFNVFLPQIGDKLFDLFQKATNEADAFQEDPDYKNFTNMPVVKSTSALMKIVEKLCMMLHTMSNHQEEFSPTVTKNSSETEEPDGRNQPGISATWVQQDQLTEVLGQYPYLFDSAKNRRKRKVLCQKEIQVEMDLKKNRLIRSSELITENKKLMSLGSLYHSLKWFNAKIWEMRGRSAKSASSNANAMDDSGLAKINKRWSQFGELTNFDVSPKEEKDNNETQDNTSLPLTGEMANRLDALLATFQQLAEQCLFTLRVELRCHAMYYLDLATREGNYQLDYEAYEPDPYVLALNAGMAKFEEIISVNLPLLERRQVFL
ncbi:2665_t:CDS:10 [Diversispora eburnea]|uniref:Exocyst complex component Sec8 n=1 Tax=Diversispora eburnea TaxID=1213867 RepID=A0A9N9B207_9GLOM|nr:2665_t:CDS:10 [Diversispora eburnea]